MTAILKTCLTVLTILVFTNVIYAQESKPSLAIQEITIEDNTRAAKSIKGKLSKRLKKDFTVADNGFLQLSSVVTLGDMHVINGMDTYTTSEASVDYAISAPNLPSDKISLPLKVKGKNERDLINKFGTSIIRDKKHMTALTDFLDAYLKENLTSCTQITGHINSSLADKDIAGAFGMLGYYDWMESCEDEKSKAEKSIEEGHNKYVCDVLIQKCSILANGADVNDLNQAIDLLQMIPPDASCAEEAIKVSEKVSENAAKLSAHSAKKLEDRIVIINSHSQSDWRSWYRKNYTKIYNRR